ncbi:MAG: SDR family NAD(P)-dependent oxidoreductase [Oculatellaceae cyanobacterium bins.114]|nr:SDR family NAD(P)-dependent oxidoreductase [Oculatellaceae cyanobacterium bins.114]
MTRRLEEKVTIVTGAGTEIGEAIAHKFAKEGATVVVNGLIDDPIIVNRIEARNPTLARITPR